MTPLPPAIQVRDLYYAYPPPVSDAPPTEVLTGVSFDVQPGQFVGLLGRVGAGKTTLCLALNGLAPHATGGVFRGHVRVGGLDTRDHTVPGLAQTVGLVFQDPETQLTQMRVEDEVAFGPENLGLSRHEIGVRVNWALDAVGLDAYRDRNPALLSGGEKQRVTLAATLAMRPSVLVLDEPTDHLDPNGKAAVFAVLLRLARQRQITIVLATQDVERAQRYCERLLVLHEGRIALDGSPRAVFAHDRQLRDWGVGAPQMVELARLLSHRSHRSHHFDKVSSAVVALRHELPRSDPPKAAHVSADPQAGSEAPSSAVNIAQIVVEHLTFAYGDDTVALRDVSLAIPSGEFLVLAGPNGSGKTTLAKHLNGLLRPTRGRVTVAGLETASQSVGRLARLVGYVFQNPDHQIFAPTVREEVAFGLRLQGLAIEEIEHRVESALQAAGLQLVADLPPATLSLGQRRLVTLAAVLATRPAILVLDEPTGGLDWRTQGDLMDRVAAFNNQGGTVVLITHDMRLIAEYANRVVVLDSGRVLFDDTPATLFAARAVLTQARLTAPPVVRVAQRLQALGGPTALARVRSIHELANVLEL